MPVKICSSCGQSFDTTFVIDGKKHWMARRTRCLACFPYGSSRADPVEVRKAKGRKRQREWIDSRREKDGRNPYKTIALRKKQAVVDLVGGGCQLCGYSKCLRSLTFHHLRDKVHGLTLREFQKSWGVLVPELRKCVLLCHNCHGEIHEGLVAESRLVQPNKELSKMLGKLVRC